MILNDVQSKINKTNIAAYEKPDSIEKLGQLISNQSKNGNKIWKMDRKMRGFRKQNDAKVL